jgi:hypothetical protein
MQPWLQLSKLGECYLAGERDLSPRSSSGYQLELVLVLGRAFISTVFLIRDLRDAIGKDFRSYALSTTSGAIEADATGVCSDLTEGIAAQAKKKDGTIMHGIDYPEAIRSIDQEDCGH